MDKRYELVGNLLFRDLNGLCFYFQAVPEGEDINNLPVDIHKFTCPITLFDKPVSLD